MFSRLLFRQDGTNIHRFLDTNSFGCNSMKTRQHAFREEQKEACSTLTFLDLVPLNSYFKQTSSLWQGITFKIYPPIANMHIINLGLALSAVAHIGHTASLPVAGILSSMVVFS
jgi:hypothetical protein